MSVCDGMNDEQREIAETTEGILVVDAGPGTGKTFTIINRYMNIISREDVEPRDVLLLTFTHNAADEMKERILNELYERGERDIDVGSVRASTFDSFCSNILTRDTSRIHEYLGIDERLSRQVRLVENEAMNRRFFQEFYERFLDRHAKLHGETALLLWDQGEHVRRTIEHLLTLGTCPTAGGWFRGGSSLLTGDIESMTESARVLNREDKPNLRSYIERFKDHRPGSLEGLTSSILPDSMVHEAIAHDRGELFHFIHHVFMEYLRASIRENRLTFQMVAFFAFLSLYNDRSLREAETYRYVMIDEFQDTNELQFLIGLLILKEPNLCVVGDWKQGIYGFRFADTENILEFDARLDKLMGELGRRCRIPAAQTTHRSLRVNYRSADRVIKLSERTLFLPATKDESMDPTYIESKLVRLRSKKSHIDDRDCRVRFLRAEDQKAEVDLVLAEAQRMVSDGLKVSEWTADGYRERPMRYSDIAVLSRKRNLLHMLERRAREIGLPLLMDGDMEIFSSPEGKTVLAWLRLMLDPGNDRAIASIMDREDYAHDIIDATVRGASPLPEDIRTHRDFLLGRQRDPNLLLTSIFQRYRIDNDISQAIISQLTVLLGGSLTGSAELVSLIEENIRQGDSYPADMISVRDAIRIHTMHGAKGLEYPAVIIAGLNSSDMPSNRGDSGPLRFDRLYGLRCVHELVEEGGLLERYRDWRSTLATSLTQKEYDEERRLFYVAVSRAMQHLVLTCHNPSLFMTGLAGDSLADSQSSPESLLDTQERIPAPRPELDEAMVVRRSIGVHSILRPILTAGGLGTEHGSRVHADAERLVHGMEPWDDHPGLEIVRRVLSEAAGSRITPEIDCLLPVGDLALEGRIDLMVEHDDRVEIHDWKTDLTELNHSEYVIQLSAYAHAAGSLGKPVSCHIHYLERGETKSFEPIPFEELRDIVNDRTLENTR